MREDSGPVKDLCAELAAPGHRAAMPILAFPGAALAGCSVRELVTDAGAQVAAQQALHQRLGTTCWLSAMDLSVEPEAFGAEAVFADWEVPTITGRLVDDEEQVARLPVPAAGSARTRVYLEAVRRLAARAAGLPVLAGMMGPFTLAARLHGVTEALVDTIERPALMHALLAKATDFLVAYARAFRAARADGVIVAEPMAGLLSPEALAEFSSAYLRRLVGETDDGFFSVIVHNCGARLAHLPAILGSGARIHHFGAPMDLAAALAAVPPGVVLGGNLDPTAVFVRSTPDRVREETTGLLRRLDRDPHGCVISSGCDLPPETPLANLEAFFQAVRGFRPAA